MVKAKKHLPIFITIFTILLSLFVFVIIVTKLNQYTALSKEYDEQFAQEYESIDELEKKFEKLEEKLAKLEKSIDELDDEIAKLEENLNN